MLLQLLRLALVVLDVPVPYAIMLDKIHNCIIQ